jgi:bifunctional non-homologous end joining protein LigD
MGLKKYRRKRNFTSTTEPAGEMKSRDSGWLYVVQKHSARRLHYDFRLEMGGVQKSWAIPKGPSPDPSKKHLAVHVEDHPIEYGGFEGVIPESEYGGGAVMLWDIGEWEPQGDPERGYAEGKLKFRLKGKKLKGLWMLVRMRQKGTESGENWLLIKEADKYARKDARILDEEPLSVATGRSIDEISRESDQVWSSATATEAATPRLANGKHDLFDDLHLLPGIRRTSFPTSVRPQLASAVDEIPAGDGWLHEIKFDGYRILGFRNDSHIRLVSRAGKGWTGRFPTIKDAMKRLPVDSFVMDGEVVVQKADGTTDFQALQNVLKNAATGRLQYYAFDLLYLNGFDLTRSPLIDRKEKLRHLLKGTYAASILQFSDHIPGTGPDVFRHACRYALEGVVSKRMDAVYRQRRTRDWVKSKCVQRQEFVVVGYTRPSGSRIGFGALLLGYYASAKELRFAGRVGTGFSAKVLRELSRELKSLESRSSALADPPTGADAKGVHWVEPQRVVEVEFSEWTTDGRLRQPSFKGIREDKKTTEVIRERSGNPDHSSGKEEKSALGNSEKFIAGGSASVRIDGVRITHPGKILYPDRGITKAQLADFYEQMANRILPHILGRPLTIVRCPDGQQKECFYQKHLTGRVSGLIKPIRIKEKDESRNYLIIEDLKGLMALVQLGALEIHPWGSRADQKELPDRMIFDLDPGPGIRGGELVKGCWLLKQLLESIGLISYLKTSGGKGFHLVIPLVPKIGWNEFKLFSKAVAKELARNYPQRFVAVMTKAKRNNKIYVDYQRNGRGATTVAPFSTRARPRATVSTPIAWEELNERLEPDTYTLENLPDRIRHQAQDPWPDYFDIHQSITASMQRKLKA